MELRDVARASQIHGTHLLVVLPTMLIHFVMRTGEFFQFGQSNTYFLDGITDFNYIFPSPVNDDSQSKSFVWNYRNRETAQEMSLHFLRAEGHFRLILTSSSFGIFRKKVVCFFFSALNFRTFINIQGGIILFSRRGSTLSHHLATLLHTFTISLACFLEGLQIQLFYAKKNPKTYFSSKDWPRCWVQGEQN